MASLIAIMHRRGDSVIRVFGDATQMQGHVSTVQGTVQNLDMLQAWFLVCNCNSVVVVFPATLSFEQCVGSSFFIVEC